MRWILAPKLPILSFVESSAKIAISIFAARFVV
jgi:hypothetical protein